MTMTQLRSLWTFVSLGLATTAYGQNTQPAQKQAQPPSVSKAAVPITMTEYEGSSKCATWTFLGNKAMANGRRANLQT